ncbi:hypothetical protein FE251_12770 [Georgenia wutianyii]|uniref:Uncharacterized protein n=1 Tax=Georgenia wutianyii TaxID=2585135 RepID=A0ABX5VQ38_9MICO|nr:hypothetical protein [Georgenia wutianyii]QDB80158.1 hypothetical protein FE251_12770 [Georgenia wutianyii]
MSDHTSAHRTSRGPRVGTIVWGIILLLLGLGVLAVGAGLTIDLEAALIGLLALAGVGLLVKALVARGD